jgi:hypothetical protein
MIEPKPTPVVDTPYNGDETGGHRYAKTEATPERCTDMSLRKTMLRAFDGTAHITIGKTLQFCTPPLALKILDSHVASRTCNQVAATALMDPDEWNNICRATAVSGERFGCMRGVRRRG